MAINPGHIPLMDGSIEATRIDQKQKKACNNGCRKIKYAHTQIIQHNKIYIIRYPRCIYIAYVIILMQLIVSLTIIMLFFVISYKGVLKQRRTNPVIYMPSVRHTARHGPPTVVFIIVMCRSDTGTTQASAWRFISLL